jgi:hypothetical protein
MRVMHGWDAKLSRWSRVYQLVPVMPESGRRAEIMTYVGSRYMRAEDEVNLT